MLLTVDLNRLDVHRGQLLLDVGCGEGRHCIGAEKKGADVIGLDIDRVSLDRAQLAKSNDRANVLFLQGDTLQLPFADESFDRVICSEVMEHVHDFEGATRELARITKGNGRIAITVPTAISEYLYLCLGNDYFETLGGHIRIFRPSSLARALRSAGFVPCGLGFAHALHTPYWAIRSIAGLPTADSSPIVRAYRIFLLLATQSRLMSSVERLLNYVCPKSWIIYAVKKSPPQ